MNGDSPHVLRDRMIWWLAAFLLLIGGEPAWQSAIVTIVPPPGPGVLEPASAWPVLVSHLPGSEAAGTWPYWLFAAVASGLISCATASVRLKGEALSVFCLASGLALSLEPVRLPAAVLVFSAGRLAVASTLRDRPRRWLISAGLLIGLAGLVSVDCGVVLLVLTTAFGLDVIHRIASRSAVTPLLRNVLLIWLTGLAVAALCLPDSVRIWLRPLTALWLRSDLTLDVSLSPVLWNRDLWCPGGLLAAVTITALCSPDGDRSRQLRRTATVALLSLTGLTCGVFVALALAGLAGALSDRPTSNPVETAMPQSASTRWMTFARLSCVAAGLLRIGFSFHEHGSTVLTGGIRERRVNVSGWELSGRVLLMNPGQAGDWIRGDLGGRFTPLIRDCLIAPADQLANYAGVCGDIRHGRKHHHLRPDGTWGGYEAWLQEWNPALIVLESSDLQAIRWLSIDPDWRLLSIDSRRTVFGRASLAGCREQAARAGRLLFHLEWPHPVPPETADGILEPGTAADSRRVAAVLNAIRLPWAAIRVLPLDQHPETIQVRVWSDVELAHRTLRQTGQPSLIDHFRAMRGLSSLRQSTRSRSELRQIDAAIASLRYAAFLSRHSPSLPGSTTATGYSRPAPEEQVRGGFINGQDETLRTSLREVTPEPLRDWYAALAVLSHGTAADAYEALMNVMRQEASGLPVRIRAESSFYLGCLALELGRPDEARGHFLDSHRTEPFSHMAGLRDFYLAQLGTPPVEP